jgi:cupin 2 domain-containing protein
MRILVGAEQSLDEQGSKSMQSENIFADAASPQEGERFDALLSHRNLRIERIISSSRVAPHAYVQTQDEWVMLVRGQARLLVNEKSILLNEGDYLFLPAGTPHMVVSTSEGAMWLAVHLDPEAAAGPHSS